MKINNKLEKNFTTLPLFFQVFALSCGLMFVIALYGLVTESFREARVFFYSGLTGIFMFFLLNLAISNRNIKESGVIQLASLILLFLLLPIFLAFPIWIILPNINFLDAYVDMVGNFTTTGLPILDKDTLTKTIHLWRSLIAWFGGGLILIAAFVILLPASSGGFDVFSSKKVISKHNRKPTLDERSTTLTKVSKRLIPIYVALTFTLWCALTSLGTEGYTSLIRAFSILSTSGISGAEKFGFDGAGFFGELIMAMFLLLALTHNFFYSLHKSKNLKNILLDKELRLGLLTAFCITLILSLKTMSLDSSFLNFDENFLSGLKLIWGHFFTAFSFITTNGYISSYWGGTYL